MQKIRVNYDAVKSRSLAIHNDEILISKIANDCWYSHISGIIIIVHCQEYLDIPC
jgi:hypothetical protein